MKLPVSLFVEGISPGKVYYFSSEKLTTSVPHFFICVSRTENNLLILVCCTSQFEKRKKFIESRNLPYSTLVWIKPNEDNGLNIDSYVDCNSYYDYMVNDFAKLYENDLLEYKGEISESHLEQIRIGLQDSPIIEEFVKDIIRVN